MKSFFIKMIIDAAFDAIISALETQAKKSTNTIDDDLVDTLRDNKAGIINEVKRKL